LENSLDPDLVAAMGREIHGLSSAAKPLASWIARDAIQVGREACGGDKTENTCKVKSLIILIVLSMLSSVTFLGN